MSVENQELGKITQAKDYRVVYTNTVSMQFNGSELILKFAILNDLGNAANGHVEQIGVAMNSANMKALSQTLGAMIAHHEKLTGMEIPVNPKVKESIDKLIAEASKKKP